MQTKSIISYLRKKIEPRQCGILTYVDSDQPVQPPLKLRNSK